MTTDRALGFSSLAPGTDEVSTTLPVDGSIPAWLSGTLIRNGPGTFAVGDDREVDHWFDGLAMLHAFSFGNGGDSSGGEAGGVTYRNRFLDTDAYRAARAGDFAGGFATGETTLRDRLKAFFVGDPYDNTNVVAERIGRRYLALTESPRWVEFDPRSLETIGDVQYRGPKPSGQLACAHVQRDPWTGTLVNFGVEFGRRSAYHVYEMDRPSRREHVVSVPVDAPAYMHSFALTHRFVVLTEFPFVVDPVRVLRPGRQGPFIENFEWQPERGTRFYVIDRSRKKVIAAPRTDPVFGFHHVNAYERETTSATDDHELVIDLETVPDAKSIGALSLADLREGDLEIPGGAIERFRVRVHGRARASVDREEIYPGATGLPTVSPARWCREYRYAYAQGGDQPMTDWLREIVKIDVETGEVDQFTDDGNYLSEPIFVPRSASSEGGAASDGDGDESEARDGVDSIDREGLDRGDFRFPDPESGPFSEDDGAVLVVSLDPDAGRSSLLVLDGESMTERARAPVPHAIPFDFHGRYFPELTRN